MYLYEEEDVFWALSQLMAHPKYAMHGETKTKKRSILQMFINQWFDNDLTANEMMERTVSILYLSKKHF